MGELKISDFSGGKTDHYLNGNSNCSREIENFLINRNRKPEQRSGFEINDSNYYQIPAGNQRIGRVQWFKDVLFHMSARGMYYVDLNADVPGWQTLTGPVDENPFFGAGDEDTLFSATEWNNHLYVTCDEWSKPRKIYKDIYYKWQCRSAGLPELASAPTVTPDNGDAKSHLYFFHYKYSYQQEGDVTFEDYGSIRQVLVSNSADMSGTGHYNQITGIPVLVNGSTECYDTDNITVEIWRTVDAGTTGYYVGSVTNGTTTYEDTTPDDSLSSQTVYSTGGVVDFDSAPEARFCVNCNDIIWYGCIRSDDGKEHKNRIRQSVQGNPDACPESFYTDLDADITGMAQVGIYPLVFNKDRCWRLEGYVDSTGRGYTKKRVISDTVGSVGQQSLVLTQKGVFFCALDGFYFTDGFGVQKLSNHLNDSYSEIVGTQVQQDRISGAFDRRTGRVYWATYLDDGSTDNNRLWVLDPYWGLGPESTFTCLSSGDDLNPTCIQFKDGVLYHGDINGYVFKHEKLNRFDPVVDTGSNPSTWQNKAVMYDLQGCSYSFGTETGTKWTTMVYCLARNRTNISMQLQSMNDDVEEWIDLKEKRFRSNIQWGDTDVVWGDADVIWGYRDEIKIKRRFPAGSLRCIYKAIRMKNSYTVISGSDLYQTATVDASAKTLTLSTTTWPEGCEGYFIHVEDDSYSDGLEITDRTDTVVTVTDDNGTLVDGTKEWLIKGYRKGEIFHPTAYIIRYEVMGESFDGYQASEDGGNA